MNAAADEQVAGERPGGRMVDHLVHLQFVAARAGLEEEVVGQILDEVAGGEDVVAVPRSAVRVLWQRTLTAGEEVVRVADALDVREWISLERVRVRVRGRSTGQHRVDRCRDELDVSELLRSDVGDQVVERPGPLPTAKVQ